MALCSPVVRRVSGSGGTQVAGGATLSLPPLLPPPAATAPCLVSPVHCSRRSSRRRVDHLRCRTTSPLGMGNRTAGSPSHHTCRLLRPAMPMARPPHMGTTPDSLGRTSTGCRYSARCTAMTAVLLPAVSALSITIASTRCLAALPNQAASMAAWTVSIWAVAARSWMP